MIELGYSALRLLLLRLYCEFINTVIKFVRIEKKNSLHWKTWSECVKMVVNKCGLAGVDPLDRDAWRAGVRHSLVLPTP